MSGKHKEDPYESMSPIVAVTLEVQRRLTERNDSEFVWEQLSLLVAAVRADQAQEDRQAFMSGYRRFAKQADQFFLDMNQKESRLVQDFRLRQEKLFGEPIERGSYEK